MSFKKLICNLLLETHPTYINRWANPILICNIHKYYLNYYSIYFEYLKTDNILCSYIGNINDTLIYSILHSNMTIIKWCLKNDADIHTQNDYALRYTADQNQLEIVKFLIGKGANVNACNSEVLRKAIENKRTNMIKLLLANSFNFLLNKN